MKRLEDLKRGLGVINDKLEEKIAFLCGKAGIDMDDPMLVSDGTPDMDGNEVDGVENQGAMDGQTDAAQTDAMPTDIPPADAGAVAPADATMAAPDASAAPDAASTPTADAGAVAPADATMAAPDASAAPEEGQQPVQEGTDGDNPLADAIKATIKTPEDAAKVIKNLQESMSESCKRRFIKGCVKGIKENVDECKSLTEGAQNSFVKGYIKSFMNGYDEVTESDDGDVEITESDLFKYIDEMDESHASKVFEDFVQECGMTEAEILEKYGDSIDDEMVTQEQDENLDNIAAQIS